MSKNCEFDKKMGDITPLSIDDVIIIYNKVRSSWSLDKYTDWNEAQVLNNLLRHDKLMMQFSENYSVCWNFIKCRDFDKKKKRKWNQIIEAFKQRDSGLISQEQLQDHLVKKLIIKK
jgi:hypothetical protein